MSSETVISVQNVSKAYRIWSSPSQRLAGPVLQKIGGVFPSSFKIHQRLKAKASSAFRDFHALQDLSFDVGKGEGFGIIGRNGSGKSTLLQIIAGTLQPTTGRVMTQGRVAALLELGSGFNPEFTGRENVFLNGAILGFSQQQMAEKFDEIAAFADIGDFIDEPVKTYSSGMMVRLAFAVQVAVEPDILIVDEALSVGDIFFTQKCFKRIHEIIAKGTTLFFVSHDLTAVQNLCDHGILLHQGKALFMGAPEECVSRYYALYDPPKPAAGSATEQNGERSPVSASIRSQIIANNILPHAKSRHGQREFELVAAEILDEEGRHILTVEMGHPLTMRLLLKANQPLNHPASGVVVHDRMSNLVFACGTPQRRFPLPRLLAGEEIALEFKVSFALQTGEYTIGFDASEYDPANQDLGIFYDRVTGIGPITVNFQKIDVLPFYGITNLPMEIKYA